MARLADPQLAERRRDQILHAAKLCFQRKGFHRATMQEICLEAEISAGALYRYFDSKSELIAAIVETERGEFEQGFPAMAQDMGLINALCLAMEKFLQKASREGEGNIFADVCAEASRDPVLHRRLLEIDRASLELFARVIAEAQARGEVDPELSPPLAAQTLAGAMEGLALRTMFTPEGAPEKAVICFRLLAQRYLGGSA